MFTGPDKFGWGKYLSWVSFLDGMQRVSFFTDDPNQGPATAYTQSPPTGSFVLLCITLIYLEDLGGHLKTTFWLW